MRIALLVAIAVCFAWSNANSTDPPKPPYDLAFVAQFVTGEYVLIGRKPESDATYTGRMIFTQQGKDLEFTRTVGGDTQRGPVVLDTKAVESGRPVCGYAFLLVARRTKLPTSGTAISVTLPGLPVTFICRPERRNFPAWKRCFRLSITTEI
jgi:hypothetical protein